MSAVELFRSLLFAGDRARNNFTENGRNGVARHGAPEMGVAITRLHKLIRVANSRENADENVALNTRCRVGEPVEHNWFPRYY